MLDKKIIAIKTKAVEEINKTGSLKELFDLEKKYLGRKSEFNEILKNIKNLSGEEKKKVGQLANLSKKGIENHLEKMKKILGERGVDFEKERIDVTVPGKKVKMGHLHILSQVRDEIEGIFSGMGFEIADGPEVETEFYNFDALNIPANHPARDAWDTFWLKSHKSQTKIEKILLRTHTSPVQIRYMKKHTPPFRIIAPGKCFRHEATDAAHGHTFYQFEALMVGDDVNLANFKYIGEQFFSQFFKKDIKIRLRPSFFPFTEPSFEFDVSCTVCDGKGCPSCKGGGWLEVGGCGMVNQKVFAAAGYPRNKYQGFAWGFGFERLAMMKYKINDIRLFHSGDLRFIKQF